MNITRSELIAIGVGVTMSFGLLLMIILFKGRHDLGGLSGTSPVTSQEASGQPADTESPEQTAPLPAPPSAPAAEAAQHIIPHQALTSPAPTTPARPAAKMPAPPEGTTQSMAPAAQPMAKAPAPPRVTEAAPPAKAPAQPKAVQHAPAAEAPAKTSHAAPSVPATTKEAAKPAKTVAAAPAPAKPATATPSKPLQAETTHAPAPNAPEQTQAKAESAPSPPPSEAKRAAVAVPPPSATTTPAEPKPVEMAAAAATPASAPTSAAASPSADPAAASMHVVIDFEGAAPGMAEKAKAVAAKLRTAGYGQVELRPVNFIVSKNQVRYFVAQSADAAKTVGTLLAQAKTADQTERNFAVADFTNMQPKPEGDVLEVWLRSW